jgi:DNA-binding transcriptional MocR family regulator
MTISTEWKPDLTTAGEGPIYLALAEALERDVRTGVLQRGARLPTHRDLARALGVTVGTVTRAYAEAARMGLVGGEVGRGTFVRSGDDVDYLLRDDSFDGWINLSHNLPLTSGLDESLRPALEELVRRGDLVDLLSYQVHGGSLEHRRAGAQWLSRQGCEVRPEQVLVTGGAQHGMAVVFSTICNPGEVVLTEALTYPGMKALANLLHLRLYPVAMDEFGLRPDAFEAAARATGAKVLYCMPTLHNPTCAILPAERREKIAEIARARGMAIVEDDSYGFLPPSRPRPLCTYAPEISFYLTSASKSMTPGLRIGFLAAPPDTLERLTSSLWAITYMASPFMAEVAALCIRNGSAERMVEAKRREARARQELAASILKETTSLSDPHGFHLWLQLPDPWRSEDFASQARQRRVLVTPAEAFVVGRAPAPHAVRVCLGAVASREKLASGLEQLALILREAPAPVSSFV